MFPYKSLGHSRLFVIVVMIALLSASALISSVHAQGTQPPFPTILVEMYEWGGSSIEVFEQYLRDQGLQSGDKVLLYAHGALSGNIDADTPFAQNLASSGGYTKLVAVGFPFTTLDWQLALGSETTEQAKNVTKLVTAINRITSTPPDAFCYSAGAVVCVKTLDQDVKYGRIVLAGKPFTNQILPGMRAKAVTILNFWSDSDWFEIWILLGGPIDGADNYYRSGIAHTNWVQTMINGKPNPLLQDYAKALKGEEVESETPSEGDGQADSSGKTPNSPLFPPPPPTPNGGGAAVSFSPIRPQFFIPPTLPSPGFNIVTQSLTNPSLLAENSVAVSPELSGIDFSSLEINYFTEFSNGQGNNLGYAFKADRSGGGGVSIDVEQMADLSSDAFFIWLALPPQTFWVNLNPNEPDRIIDPELGKTDAGWIMLEADLQMKKTVAELIHPDNELGRAFWDQIYSYIQDRNLSQLCFSFRQWIVPGEVTVWTTDNSIYIVDAALDVKLESEYLELRSYDTSSAAVCPPDVDPALQEHAESQFRQMILPELIEEVNTAPEYRDLRAIFYSRIIAEWYKKQHSTSEKAIFSEFIDQDSAADWYSTKAWDKQEIFDRYVQSVTQGEFNLTRQSQQGNTIYTRTYFYGGVDFSDVPTTPITYSRLVAQQPAVEEQVFNALFTPSGYSDATEAWLGGIYLIGLPDDTLPPILSPNPSEASVPSAYLWIPAGLVLAAVLIGLAYVLCGQRCPICGMRAARKAEFCPKCGMTLGWSSEQDD